MAQRKSTKAAREVEVNGVAYAVQQTKVAPEATRRPGEVLVYPATDGYRWQLRRKGRVIADSGQHFSSKAAAQRAAGAEYANVHDITTLAAR